MTVKVHYDLESKQVIGYYPDFVNYSEIPEPNITIDDKDYKKYLGKRMLVVNDILEEYIKPHSQILEENKLIKIAEIKNIRDLKNIEPIIDTQGLLVENDIVTNKLSYFVFHTDRHPTNPAADPSAILTSVIVMNSPIYYSTKDIDGNRILIFLTPEIAKNIATHLTLRNSNNYKLAEIIINLINGATNEDEINSITWNTNYL